MTARWQEVMRISLRRTSQIGQRVRARMIDEHETLIARECDRPSADPTRQRLTVLSLSAVAGEHSPHAAAGGRGKKTHRKPPAFFNFGRGGGATIPDAPGSNSCRSCETHGTTCHSASTDSRLIMLASGWFTEERRNRPYTVVAVSLAGVICIHASPGSFPHLLMLDVNSTTRQ